MKKILAFVLAVITFMSANAGNQRATGMTMVDGFKLGVGVGTPAWGNAVMPMLTVDGAVGIASGFINSKHFGNNGGIDLGFQYGICGYDDPFFEHWAYDHAINPNVNCGLMEHLILLRSAFHYQFLKKLDTYMGFDGGVALSIPTGDDFYYEPKHQTRKDQWKHVNGVFGMYAGGTWYFNNAIGAGIEWEGDWIGGHTPGISAKFQFRF